MADMSLNLVISASVEKFRTALRDAEGALLKLGDTASHAFDALKVPEINLQDALKLPELSKSTADVERLKQSFVALGAAVGGIEYFKQMQADVDKAAKSLDEAKRKRDFLLESASKGGDAGIRLFAADIKKSREEVLSAAAALEKKTAAARAMSAALSAAGVNVGALATEEEKLKTALDASRTATEQALKVESARNKLGVRPQADVLTEIKTLESAYATLKTSGVASFSELARAKDSLSEKIRNLTGSAVGSGGLADAFGMVKGAFIALGAAIAGSKILQASDEMQLLRARLQLVEGSTGNVSRAMKDITRIANATGTEIGAVGQAYFRYASAIQKVGGTSEQTSRFTEAVARALKLSGASAEEASSTMTQLGQALMKGKLDGDEFRSVAENGGLVLDYLAKAMGKTRGELMVMSEAGKITTREMLKLGDALDQIRKDSANVPQTVGAAWTKLGNAFKTWVDQSAGVLAVSRALAAVMDVLANHFNIVAGVATTVTFAGLYASLAALGPMVAKVLPWLLKLFGGPWIKLAFVAIGLVVAFSDSISNLWVRMTGSTTEKAVNQINELRGELKKANQEISGGIANGIELAKNSIKSLGDAYKASADVIKGAMTDRLETVQRAMDAEQKALEVKGGISQGGRIDQETAALRANSDKKLAIIRNSGEQQLAVQSGTYNRLAELARMSGQDVRAVEQEGLKVRMDIYRQIVNAYRATIDHLIAEEHRHLAEVRRIEDERARMKMSTEDRIRDISRSGMDDYTARQDLLQQIYQKKSAARQALARGDFDKAKQLAEDAARLAEQSSRAVQMPGQDGKMQVVVSQAEAASKAISEIRDSANIADQAMAGLQGAHQKAADAAKVGAATAKSALKDVSDELTSLTEKALSGVTVKVRAEWDHADAIIKYLREPIEKQIFIAHVDADLADAKAAIEAWRADPKNRELKLKAEVATDKALADISTLKDDAARKAIPLKFDFADATTALGSLKKELQAPTGSVHTVNDASVLKTQAEIDKLKLDTSSTHTVYVKSVEQHAAGGLIGAVQALATGGQVFRRQVGKIFGPGTGTSDSVPLMGSAGEFMVRAASVRKYGVAFLDNINRGLLPESLITQALAPAAAFAPQPATNNGGEMRITLHGPRGETARVTSERDEAMRLVRLLKSAGVSLA